MSDSSCQDLSLEGLKKIERFRPLDSRGFFERLFCENLFAQHGWKGPVAQINRSQTKKKGTIRGLHFQHHPFAEIKIVSCIRGSLWDVAVDLRKGSPTFLQWHGEKLSADTPSSLMIPQGFAHGFQSLEENTEIMYVTSAPYSQEYEDGLHPRDPKLSIHWPLRIGDMSEKDTQRQWVSDRAFEGI